MMSNRLVVSVGSLIKALYIKEKGCFMVLYLYRFECFLLQHMIP